MRLSKKGGFMQMSKCTCFVCKIAMVLLIVGGINWGLVGAFQLDLVAKFLGPMSTASRVVYILVGVAGLMKLLTCFKECPKCCSKTGESCA